MDNITKNIAAEAIGSASEIGFAALATAAGFPPIALAAPLAKGLVLGLLENCYNDCNQRTLSVAEVQKVSQEYKIALQTFLELAEKDRVTAWEMNLEQAQIDNAFEVAEHVTLEGIRQSERKKVDILGRYLGRAFYKQDANWQDMHQMITMVGTLTLRQLVVVRLIVEGFKELDKNMFISNPSACVEINRLKDHGIWRTTGAAFGINESSPIRLDYLIPTEFAKHVYDKLLLEKLPDEIVAETISTLWLTAEGKPQDILTKEQYENEVTNFDAGTYSIDGGNANNIDEDEAQAMRDFIRGK